MAISIKKPRMNHLQRYIISLVPRLDPKEYIYIYISRDCARVLFAWMHYTRAFCIAFQIKGAGSEGEGRTKARKTLVKSARHARELTDRKRERKRGPNLRAIALNKSQNTAFKLNQGLVVIGSLTFSSSTLNHRRLICFLFLVTRLSSSERDYCDYTLIRKWIVFYSK